ncbi:MAG TPA: response regulator [Cytophagaceae bacterium]|nr:response regulator [Cytophagaceae bacterium]
MEDNEMYNSLLTKKIELYTKSLSVDSEYTFEIFSYTSLAECMKNLGEDIDIIFLDYYLVRNVTALDILSRIKEKCKDCKVFIISRSRDTEIIHKAFEHGVDDFIFKGKYGLAHSCYLIKRAIADR